MRPPVWEGDDATNNLMASDVLRSVMLGYHDLVNAGRREIYRIA